MDLTLRFPRMRPGLCSLAHVEHGLEGSMDLEDKLVCGYELMSGTKEWLVNPSLCNKHGILRARYPNIMPRSQANQFTMR